MKFNREIKIGIVALITILSFIWGFNFLKGKNLFSRTNAYYILYDEVGGLKESAYVLLHGMKAGLVSSVKLDPIATRHVVVKIMVGKNVKLPNDTKAVLFSSDLLDTKAIKLMMGNSETLLNNGDTLLSAYKPSVIETMDSLTIRANSIISSFDSISIAFKKLVSDNNRLKLEQSINDFNRFGKQIADLTDPDSALNQSVKNIQAITKSLYSQTNKINSVINNVDTISNNISKIQFTAMIDSSLQTIEHVNAILSSLNQGQGTAGELLHNDTLYHNINTTVQSLDALLKDLKENPKQYVHFSVFGKK